MRTALAHAHDGGVARIVDLDAVLAGLQQRDGEIGGIDLVELVREYLAHVHDERAGRQLHLHHAVIEIEERECRATAEPHGGAPEVEFGTRVLVAPEAVAGGHRPVQLCGAPGADARRLQGHGSLGVAQTRDATGRIGLLRKTGEGYDEWARQQAKNRTSTLPAHAPGGAARYGK